MTAVTLPADTLNNHTPIAVQTDGKILALQTVARPRVGGDQA